MKCRRDLEHIVKREAVGEKESGSDSSSSGCFLDYSIKWTLLSLEYIQDVILHVGFSYFFSGITRVERPGGLSSENGYSE